MYMKNKNFTMVPNEILEANQLSANERLLLIELHSFKWQNDSCHPGQKRLASRMNLSIRYVRTLINNLEKHGLIKTVRSGFNTSNTYYMTTQYRIEKRNHRSPQLRTTIPLQTGATIPTTKKQTNRYKNKRDFELIGSIVERIAKKD
jgi:DNA-binding MarR family transcriptional regulator